ncbi:multidrug resistance efflux pump [Paraburkholderia youngii]|uniref:Multidrug resistance efflux pump n=1 Tax=Paraburkholderia youngii TaxID=2782701 RepID=A0A7W8L6X7_9BURK|nr:hypothetical protein [Paraburkholderia youngii]MBB5401615.1 multidrug resistance efflux pump [Paraburkholderia youngii]
MGDHAKARLLSIGTLIEVREERLASSSADPDKPPSRRDLLAGGNPIFAWVRLGQRMPVRIRRERVPRSLRT